MAWWNFGRPKPRLVAQTPISDGIAVREWEVDHGSPHPNEDELPRGTVIESGVAVGEIEVGSIGYDDSPDDATGGST